MLSLDAAGVEVTGILFYLFWLVIVELVLMFVLVLVWWMDVVSIWLVG